jgi:hypothetical protein
VVCGTLTTSEQEEELTRLVRSKRTSVRLAERARIVLLAGQGLQNKVIAESRQPGGRTSSGSRPSTAGTFQGMSLGTYAVLVDKPWFENLPTEQRKAVSDSIAEIAQRQWKEAIEEDKVLIKKMVSQGAVFHTASAPELQRWKSLATGKNKAFMEKYPDATARFAALEKSCEVAK